MLASTAPGMVRARSRSWSRSTADASGAVPAAGVTFKARTLSGRKPGSARMTRSKLRKTRAPPMARAIARATSTTTRSPRPFHATRRERPRPAVPPPCRSALPTSVRLERIAGHSPKTNAVATHAPAVKTSTTASSRAWAMSNIGEPRTASLRGARACRRRSPPRLIKSAPQPPRRESSKLSASRSRISRRRLAPRAARTASSFSLFTPRASSRFATLTHAMTRTSATAP